MRHRPFSFAVQEITEFLLSIESNHQQKLQVQTQCKLTDWKDNFRDMQSVVQLSIYKGLLNHSPTLPVRDTKSEAH